MPEGVEQRDFFISFNSADLAYAEAIDAALRNAGFTTFYHPRDLGSGGNIPIWMDHALDNSAQTLALYSPAYTSDKAVYSKAERYASWWQDPGGDKRKLIPVLLRETKFTPLMAMISRVEVLGMTPNEAAAHVLQRLKRREEAEPRDVWRRGLPLPKIFNVGYRPNPNFTGRFEALESLQQSLRAGSNAAITAVAGMGGIGKTTLAAEYCHRFGGRYAGVWWVRAEQEMTMLADLAALGQRLGLPPSGNVENDARAVLEQLGCVTEPWLLVYDNAPNPDAVRQWLPVGAVRAIITSRFTEFGELAPVTCVDQWPDAVTAEYLLARTERKDADGAARLAKTLGGLPLAAEQAAAFLRPRKGVSFDDYAKEIARLIKRKRDAGITGEYPDTVYAAFVTSLETLQAMQAGDIALDLLRLCAFLSPDGVDLALVAAKSSEAVLPPAFAAAVADKFSCDDALAALTSLSLLRQEDGPVGLVLIFHRLLLEVVRDWMGDDAGALWGSSAVQLVNRLLPYRVTSPENWPLCARLMPHVAPLEAHAPRAGDAGRALGRLLNQCSVYLTERGDRAGALALVKQAVTLGRETEKDRPLNLAAALGNFAGRLVELKRLDEAEAVLREALQIHEQLLKPADPRLATTLSNLAKVHLDRRTFEKAELLLLRAMEIDRGAHGAESPEYGVLLLNLGALYGNWADEPGQEARREQATNLIATALAITRKAQGERHPETAKCYSNLGVMKAKTGDFAGAMGDMERAVAIMLSLDLAQHPDIQSRGGDLAHFWKQSGNADKAARLRQGDISDLLLAIAQIELEHRAWVADNPGSRQFGPRSFFTWSNTIAGKNILWLNALATAGVSIEDFMARMRQGVPLDEIARFVAETISGNEAK